MSQASSLDDPLASLKPQSQMEQVTTLKTSTPVLAVLVLVSDVGGE